MGKLSEMFKNLFEKWKSISNGKKIAFGVLAIGFVTAIIYLSVTLSATKYSVLFSNLDPNDSKTILDTLKQEKVANVKISGNSILVPSDQVDQLRLELAPQITDGSKGWDLFTGSSSQLVTTDQEEQVKYQVALQGELEKTIKSFPQIDKAKVTLVLPEDNVFVKDSSPASASVTLIMKTGQTLNQDQVKAIVALVSGSVKNLPKENVQIVDDKMKLLTKDLYNSDGTDDSQVATEKQQQMKKDYEKYLEDKVTAMLGKPYKDKVSVKVNADLNFDADKTVSTTYDPNGTVVSEHKVTSSNGQTGTAPSQSPVDNNMTNSSPTTTDTTATNGTNEDVTTNYEISKKEEETVKAPGQVKRLTASVIIDGNLDDATRSSIKNLVSTAIGIDETRGDAVSIEGLTFDNSDAQAYQKTINDMKQQAASENRLQLYKYIGEGVGALALLIMLGIFIKKFRSPKLEDQLQFDGMNVKGIDVVVGDKAPEKKEFKPIDFEGEVSNEKAHLEKEIKKYASEKPDQVVDIIKSWLAEDER